MAAEAQSRAPIFAEQEKRRELQLEKEEEKKKEEAKEKKEKRYYYPTIIPCSVPFSPEDDCCRLLPKKKVWT